MTLGDSDKVKMTLGDSDKMKMTFEDIDKVRMTPGDSDKVKMTLEDSDKVQADISKELIKKEGHLKTVTRRQRVQQTHTWVLRWQHNTKGDGWNTELLLHTGKQWQCGGSTLTTGQSCDLACPEIIK